jgi:hypothetical protein
MNVETVYELFSNLRNDNLSFIYLGSFNDEITERIIDISETNLASKHDEARISHKVSFLLAECFQNVIRHGDTLQKSTPDASGIFITRNIGKSFYISSANLVENKDIEELKSKIEQINNLSHDELKKLYMNVLSNIEFSSKGGAGLGLIEMARKSGQKLDFEFEYYDDKFSYFYLQIKFKSPEENEIPAEKVNVKIAKEFHHLMSIDNIFIIHKGDFSQNSTVPILRMIEDNLHTSLENNSFKKKTFHALVEILQNISKHSVEIDGKREGIFIIGKVDSKFLVYTGNFIHSNQVEPLSKHLDNLNILTKDELLQLYKYTLHLGTTTIKGGAGLGLIDVARDSSEKMQYKFSHVTDDLSFFSLQAII